MAAVAEHLAGLVETQLTYSHAHQNTAQVCFNIASLIALVSSLTKLVLWKRAGSFLLHIFASL